MNVSCVFVECGCLGTSSSTLWSERFAFTCSTPVPELLSLQDMMVGAPAQLVLWHPSPPSVPSALVPAMGLFFRTAGVLLRSKSKVLGCDNTALPLPLSNSGLTNVLGRFLSISSASSYCNVCHLRFFISSPLVLLSPTWLGPLHGTPFLFHVRGKPQLARL